MLWPDQRSAMPSMHYCVAWLIIVWFEISSTRDLCDSPPWAHERLSPFVVLIHTKGRLSIKLDPLPPPLSIIKTRTRSSFSSLSLSRSTVGLSASASVLHFSLLLLSIALVFSQSILGPDISRGDLRLEHSGFCHKQVCNRHQHSSTNPHHLNPHGIKSTDDEISVTSSSLWSSEKNTTWASIKSTDWSVYQWLRKKLSF